MPADYKRIFAALDGQKTQLEVARKAVRIAAENHADLKLGHVVDAVPTEASAVDFASLCDECREQLEDELGDILKDARANKDIKSVDLEVLAGAIADTLENRMIKKFDPDLVICGERGLSSIKYVFVGSVSTHLIRNLRCDVLVVKQD